jgi:4'-phosphopantetheinyl transferase
VENEPWPNPPSALHLGKADVHVWRASLIQSEEKLALFATLLSHDEQQRANRFIFERDRQRFITARGVLRVLLGRYLELSPETLQFSYSEHGKPQLAFPANRDIRFNVSHSHELALYAFARSREIGVDVEHINEHRSTQAIAERFFSEREVETFLSVPRDQRVEAFFNCWSRKEAYIKGRGQGLSFSLRRFDVSLVPGSAAQLLDCREPGNESTPKWSLKEINARPGYAAALAVEGEASWQLSCWQWK